MKSIFGTQSLRRALFTALMLVVGQLSTHASLLTAGVNSGYADSTPNNRWAIFTLNSALGDVNVLSSSASIWGDAGFAGTGNNLSGTGSIGGQLVYNSTGTMAKSSSFITGGTNTSRNATLVQGAVGANYASSAPVVPASGVAQSGNSNLSGTGSIRDQVGYNSVGTISKPSSFAITGGTNTSRSATLAEGAADGNNVSSAVVAFASTTGYPTPINQVTSPTLNKTTSENLTAGFNLGYADKTPDNRWAVFALNSKPGDVNVMSAGASIWGDAGFSGTGNSNLSGTGSIRGQLVYNSAGTMAKSSGFTITGGINTSRDAALAQGATDANNASSMAFALPSTAGYPTTINQNTSLTLNDTTGGNVVLHLTDFVLSGSAVLTLQGTATTTYIINVTNKFTLSGNSIVQLSGVQSENVLFNVVGSGDATMSSSAVENGIILATNRTMKMSGSATVYGQVIANKVSMSGTSSVRRPISP